MDPRDTIGRLLPGRGKLIEELAGCLTVSEARWGGDPQTIVHVDRLLPTLAAPRGTVENDGDDADANARWRVLTAKPPHLYGFPAARDVLKEFHRADARKGRRLLVRDLDAGHIAAILAWHFEEGPPEDAEHKRSRGKRLRPHLVTSIAIRQDAATTTRGEYMVMLWHLLLVVAAIDRRTVKRGRVGVVADSAISLTPEDLRALGLRKGPSSRHGGYPGRAYYELAA
ncbi:MAG: hypothetical protein ACRDK7_14530 [Solirubrobacteraceae bacterium]